MDEWERVVVGLAGARYRYPGARETAMIELGLTPTAFWALVGRLIVEPRVVAEMPEVCGRLGRLAEKRAAARSARRIP